MKASIYVVLEKDNGTKVSREVRVESPYYGRESSKTFRQRARKQAISALNAVFGVRDDVVVEVQS